MQTIGMSEDLTHEIYAIMSASGQEAHDLSRLDADASDVLLSSLAS